MKLKIGRETVVFDIIYHIDLLVAHFGGTLCATIWKSMKSVPPKCTTVADTVVNGATSDTWKAAESVVDESKTSNLGNNEIKVIRS